jgi:predicted site-specific integrase-resolvase
MAQEVEALWVRPKQACQIIGVGLSKLYQMMAEGKLATTKLDGMRLIEVKELRRLCEGTGKPAAPRSGPLS